MTGYVNILKEADIFYKLTTAQLDLIANYCIEQTYHAGDPIFEEGKNGGELYVIAQGAVDIRLDPSLTSNQPDAPHEPLTIATLRRGQSFGEVALVDDGMRSASARAAQNNTRLLILPKNKLLEICEADPRLGYRLMRNLAADLAFKIRNADLLLRDEILYRSR